jgi:hypothetical protein
MAPILLESKERAASGTKIFHPRVPTYRFTDGKLDYFPTKPFLKSFAFSAFSKRPRSGGAAMREIFGGFFFRYLLTAANVAALFYLFAVPWLAR